MMRILFLADVTLANPASGSEQVLYHQATGLAREDKEIRAITRKAGASDPILRDLGGVKEACYSASSKHVPSFFFALLKHPTRLYDDFIEEGPFAAVVCHQPFTCLALVICGRLRGIPLLYVFHSPSHEEYLLSHENKRRLRMFPQVLSRKMAERFCLKRALRIMVLSQFMKEKIQVTYRLSAELIMVNPGGVDLERFMPYPNRSQLKKKLGFPDSKLHLLTVRNLESRMGLDNLLKCIYLLKKDGMPVHLSLGGEGSQRQKLEKTVGELGLAEDVSMTGFVPAELLPQYYAAADFFVLPTRELEGFGLVTPESMACGSPVLGTPVGGTKEILSKFDARFLFRDTSPEAMADGIRWASERYRANGEAYEELRLRCREHAAKHYSWGRHIEQLKTILTHMVMSKSDTIED